jgi:hypothetical protein
MRYALCGVSQRRYKYLQNPLLLWTVKPQVLPPILAWYNIIISTIHTLLTPHHPSHTHYSVSDLSPSLHFSSIFPHYLTKYVSLPHRSRGCIRCACMPARQFQRPHRRSPKTF